MRCFAALIPIIAILQLRTPQCDAVNVTAIRLINEATGAVTSQTGIVQIQIDGDEQVWGAICDDGFGDNDAVVVCRMLGFTNGGTADPDGSFPIGAERVFLLDDTRCAGDEDTLTECTAAQQPDCAPDTDTPVGVACNDVGSGQQTAAPATTTQSQSDIITGNCDQGTNPDPAVELDGKDNVDGMGFVRVRNPNNQNEWGYVCDDGWNSAAALVVCRELCYDTNSYTPKPGVPAEHAIYPTNPNIVKDDVACLGTEANLADCPSSAWGVENCAAGELAGVQCLPADNDPPPAPLPELECRDGTMIAEFSLVADPALEEKHLIVYDQGVECPDVIKERNDAESTVTISIPVNKCGTTDTLSNTSFIVYQNTITYLYTTQEGQITRDNTYQITITCSLPTGGSVTQRVQPLTEAVTQSAQGVFQASMAIYRNDSFDDPVTSSPVMIPLGEYLNMAVAMEDYDSTLKLVLTDCVATPTGDTSGTAIQDLITDKCAVEETLSIYPIDNFKMGFRFKPFKFIGHDLLYVHCNTIICRVEDQTSLCDRSCNNAKPDTARKKRAIYDKEFQLVTSPTIILYDPNTLDVNDNSQSNIEVDQVEEPIVDNANNQVNAGTGSTAASAVTAATTSTTTSATTSSTTDTTLETLKSTTVAATTLRSSDSATTTTKTSAEEPSSPTTASSQQDVQTPFGVDSPDDTPTVDNAQASSDAASEDDLSQVDIDDRPVPPSFISSKTGNSGNPSAEVSLRVLSGMVFIILTYCWMNLA